MAALLFTSRDESRYVLNGLLIEAEPGSKPRIVATDGRRLAVVETVAEQSDDLYDPVSIVMRPDVVKPLCALSKAFGGRLNPWIELDLTTHDNPLGVKFVGTHTSVVVGDGAFIPSSYPDWRKVVPSKNATRRQCNDLGFNADLIADYSKVAVLLEVAEPAIAMNVIGKEEAIEVKLVAAPTFYSLIMQMKVADGEEYQPEFVAIAKACPPVKPKSEEEAPV